MDFDLKGSPKAEPEPLEEAPALYPDGEFRLSVEPRIPVGVAVRDDPLGAGDHPQSYGKDTLCLMARDPHSVFAFWEIDWTAAFGAAPPPDKTVHLQMFQEDGTEESRVPVEPTARSCSVTVSAPDTVYTAQLGYYDAAGGWRAVATADAVRTPPSTGFGPADAERATIPFHLSFQSMLDSMQPPKEEAHSLVGMLAELRARAASAAEASVLTAAERGLVKVIDEAVAQVPAGVGSATESVIEWSQEKLAEVLGLGSSPAGGFIGSSRSS